MIFFDDFKARFSNLYCVITTIKLFVMINVRHFRIKGKISCNFEPESPASTVYLAGLEVQLWQKNPIEVIYLGSSFTDQNGDFIIDINIDSPVDYIIDGKIEGVFLKVYNQDQLIIGGNPY